MRALLSTTSGAGHFRPLLPLARAMAAAGHEVACAAPSEAARMVEREGLRHYPFDGVPPGHPERIAAFTRAPNLPPAEARHLVGSVVFGRLNTTAALPGAVAAVEEFAPDVIVHETSEHGVRLAGEAAGVPVVGVAPTLWSREFPRAMAAGVAHLRESLGLAPDVEGSSLMSGPCVSWFPRSFDLPDAPAQVRRFRDGLLPPPSPSTERTLIYVTLGTEAAGMPFFEHALEQVVRGAAQTGLPVLVSTGSRVGQHVLADLPAHVQVHAWVNQAEVLQRARVVVCHAGAGTTLGALAAQVPIVAVPLFADQPDNADRIEGVGCGRRVAPVGDDVARAVSDLIDRAPEGCARVGSELAALPDVAEAVPWLDSVAR